MTAKFIAEFNKMQKIIHNIAVEKGWWEKDRNFGEAIALIHCELSEAMEAYRENDPPSKKAIGRTQIEEELADAIIRIMDIATGFDLRVAEALEAKVQYNSTRPYRHGGKKA